MRQAAKILIMAAIGLASCRQGQKEMDVADYKRFVEAAGNGYHKEVTAGDLIYSIQYRPYEYIPAAEQQWNVDTAVLMKRCRQLAGTVWFNVGIRSKKGGANPLKATSADINDYNGKLGYFLSAAERQFRLYYNGELMERAGYFFENNYGLTPADVMIVGFKVPDKIPAGDMTLEYDDELYQTGTIKVKIDKEALLELHQIKILL